MIWFILLSMLYATLTIYHFSYEAILKKEGKTVNPKEKHDKYVLVIFLFTSIAFSILCLFIDSVYIWFNPFARVLVTVFCVSCVGCATLVSLTKITKKVEIFYSVFDWIRIITLCLMFNTGVFLTVFWDIIVK